MGHNIRVHKEYYTLPDDAMRVAKLSKIFLALDKGALKGQAGRSLDELLEGCSEDSDSETGISVQKTPF